MTFEPLIKPCKPWELYNLASLPCHDSWRICNYNYRFKRLFFLLLHYTTMIRKKNAFTLPSINNKKQAQ
jgi:hypothetical protein